MKKTAWSMLLILLVVLAVGTACTTSMETAASTGPALVESSVSATTTTTMPTTTTQTVPTTTSTLTASTTTTAPGIPVKLVRVVDGDTIVVLMPDGSEEKVRYIGIDCPEAGDDYGPAATAYNKDLLTSGPLRLELDVQERDKYGRLLAYVWAGDVFVNHRLVLDGYAQVATYPPNVKYVDEFLSAQRLAQVGNYGLWGAATTTTTLAAGMGDGDVTVYITRTGEKYHRGTCRYLSKSKIPISLADAKDMGYEPCKVCKPPQ